MHNYKKIEVWQIAMDFNVEVYELCNGLPKDERFRIIDQLTRASVSIAANIAEGFGRQHVKEIRQFLYISLGSAYESETLLLLIKRLGWMLEKQYELLEKIIRIQKMLQSLIKRFS